jgi:hypothetical protein
VKAERHATIDHISISAIRTKSPAVLHKTAEAATRYMPLERSCARLI